MIRLVWMCLAMGPRMFQLRISSPGLPRSQRLAPLLIFVRRFDCMIIILRGSGLSVETQLGQITDAVLLIPISQRPLRAHCELHALKEICESKYEADSVFNEYVC